MKVLFVKEYNTTLQFIAEGTELYLDEKAAQHFIDGGYAEVVKPKKERAVVKKSPEKAVPED